MVALDNIIITQHTHEQNKDLRTRKLDVPFKMYITQQNRTNNNKTKNKLVEDSVRKMFNNGEIRYCLKFEMTLIIPTDLQQSTQIKAQLFQLTQGSHADLYEL